MAKKKAGKKKAKRKAAKPAKKKSGKKASKKKKPARKSAAKKKAAKKKSAKKSTGGKKVKKSTRKKSRKKKSLGRARVPGHSHLDDLFRKDVQAREVFEYLRVHTLKELEEHTPEEIIDRMTRPVVQTVDRIRKALALSNRCLKEDEEFALEFQNRVSGGK